MARHPVAANLLMLVFILGGLVFSTQVKQEVFPELELDIVQITVPYPGASPEEVEQGIVLAVEEEVRGIDGIKRITSTAAEGVGSVIVELLSGADPDRASQDVKNAIDRIRSFPEEAERPTVNLLAGRREVISLILYGDLDETTLRAAGERVRDELLVLPDVTQVELAAIRPLEVSVEIPEATLRAYGTTLGDVASTIRRTALELPGGAVKSAGGEVLLRTQERRDFASEFRKHCGDLQQ